MITPMSSTIMDVILGLAGGILFASDRALPAKPF